MTSQLCACGRASVLAVGLLAIAPVVVRAADQTVLGNVLLVKNPSTPEKRKITAKAKEVGTDNVLVGDPTVTGATLEMRVTGAVPSGEGYTLPTGISASGKPFWSGDAIKGFTYKDSRGENGPVKVAQLRNKNGMFQIKAILTAKFQPIAVHPPDPGTGGCLLITITGGDSYSVAFATGQITNNGAKLFKVARPTVQNTCVTTTTSSTTSSTSTSSTTSTSTTSTSTTSSTTLVFPDLLPTAISGPVTAVTGESVSVELHCREPGRQQCRRELDRPHPPLDR